MIETCRKILDAAKLDENQILTIIYDNYEKPIADSFLEASRTMLEGGLVKKIYSFNLDDYGERPLDRLPEEVFSSAEESDLLLILLTKKHANTEGEYSRIRKPLIQLKYDHNIRIGAIYDITPEAFVEAFMYDPQEVHELNLKILALLQDDNEIVIKTPAGTDLVIRTTKHYSWINQDADLSVPSPQHSLLAGEVYTYPANVNGRMVVDGVMGGNFAKYDLSEPLIIDIKDGKVTDFETKNIELDNEFRHFIYHYENFSRVGELGFGTNVALKKLYNILGVDEKFPGNHLAFGNPYPKRTGAEWHCKTHVDCVLKNCTTWINGQKVLENGKYLI